MRKNECKSVSMGPPCADKTATTPCHPRHPNRDSKREKQRAAAIQPHSRNPFHPLPRTHIEWLTNILWSFNHLTSNERQKQLLLILQKENMGRGSAALLFLECASLESLRCLNVTNCCFHNYPICNLGQIWISKKN